MYTVSHKDSGSRQQVRIAGKMVDVPVYETGDTIPTPVFVLGVLDSMKDVLVKLPRRLQDRSKFVPRTSTPKQYRNLGFGLAHA